MMGLQLLQQEIESTLISTYDKQIQNPFFVDKCNQTVASSDSTHHTVKDIQYSCRKVQKVFDDLVMYENLLERSVVMQPTDVDVVTAVNEVLNTEVSIML